MEYNFANNPSWDLSTEYHSFDDIRFTKDIEDLKLIIEKINHLSKSLTESQIEDIQKVIHYNEQAEILIENTSTYITCRLSVDSKDIEAQKKYSEYNQLSVQLKVAMTKPSIFLKKCSDEVFQKIFTHPELKPSEFLWTQERTEKPYLLSDKEESLIKEMEVHGLRGWGDLYDNLSGSIKVEVEKILENNSNSSKAENNESEKFYGDNTFVPQKEIMGLAKAHSLTRGPDESLRKAAWLGIQKAWITHEESAAAILNHIAGWRLDLYKKRSHTQNLHFLDPALKVNRMSQKTLDAMMATLEHNRPQIQKAALNMARLLGKAKLDPWDLQAPPPTRFSSKKSESSPLLTYEKGIEIIQKVFKGTSSEMADFVKLCDEQRWIETTVGPRKTTGAYCTQFKKSRTPRVYMTFMGSQNDLSTLAHELGHAFHSWVLKDLPISQTEYPMTLAETASIFSETLLNETLLAETSSPEERKNFLWNSASAAVGLLLNIPARFTFEKNFYEMRKTQTLTPDDFKKLTEKAWSHWYGDSLSEMDTMFWAHKLHFSIAGLSFYNFPYTFGYLFSLSIYARKEALGSEFMDKYKNILRDTGRMNAEELIQKHLNEDISQPEFWQNAVNVVIDNLQEFEKSVAQSLDM